VTNKLVKLTSYTATMRETRLNEATVDSTEVMPARRQTELLDETLVITLETKKGNGKGCPYSTPSVGPGADPGVQAVSLQVTVSHPPGGRLPLLSASRQACSYLPSRRASPPFGRYQVILLGDRGT